MFLKSGRSMRLLVKCFLINFLSSFFSLMRFRQYFFFLIRSLKGDLLDAIFGGHELDQIDDSIRISIFVVIPGDEFDESAGEHDTSLGIEN